MGIFITYFSSLQLWLLIAAAASIGLSAMAHIRHKDSLAITLLFLSAFLIYSFAALLDPFLNIWDERFHALVARNVMLHPFRPTLYEDPVVDTSYDSWVTATVWLHKQPLFLWQIALSFKLFGISEFSLRLPSAIMGSLLVWVTVRSGSLLNGPRSGYLAGIFTLTSIYIIQLVSGRQGMEHNDMAFLFYISLSLWALIEYEYSGRRRWVYLIGLFSGMAILVKWLVGLLVYLTWGLLRIQQRKFAIHQNRDILVALGITLVVALPWQVYTFIAFPQEAWTETVLHASHFGTALEGHRGPFGFHFLLFDTLFGPLASIFILPALVAMWTGASERRLSLSLSASLVFVYLFFSLAATKLQSFPIINVMIVNLAFGALVDRIIRDLTFSLTRPWLKSTLLVLAIGTVVGLRFDVEALQEKHTLWRDSNEYSRMLAHNKGIFTALDLPADAVLFNVRGRHYVDAMFYTGLPAYRFVPTEEQYRDLRAKGRRAAIFKPEGNNLPDYLSSDTSVIAIDTTLQGYD
jgi:4-amino-4-deoxy-L-arabinose transferase